jgi:hypothetical protein
MPHPLNHPWCNQFSIWFAQVQGSVCHILTCNFFFLRLEVVSSVLNPQTRWPPTVGFPRLLIQYIRSYPPPSGVRLLHPQLWNATCRADKGYTSRNNFNEYMFTVRIQVGNGDSAKLQLYCKAYFHMVFKTNGPMYGSHNVLITHINTPKRYTCYLLSSG